MAKSKDIRITITLECTSCAQKDQTRPAGVSRYTTQKNRRNTPNRIELNKFCKHCGAHSLHKEIKK